MNVRIQVVTEHDGAAVVQEVACIERAALCPETLGLSLEEAKALLANVQAALVAHQVEVYTDQRRCCPHCGQVYARKSQDSIVVRTLFGKLELTSPRLYTCDCQPHAKQRVLDDFGDQR